LYALTNYLHTLGAKLSPRWGWRYYLRRLCWRVSDRLHVIRQLRWRIEDLEAIVWSPGDYGWHEADDVPQWYDHYSLEDRVLALEDAAHEERLEALNENFENVNGEVLDQLAAEEARAVLAR
jgi:hypothetical protein